MMNAVDIIAPHLIQYQDSQVEFERPDGDKSSRRSLQCARRRRRSTQASLLSAKDKKFGKGIADPPLQRATASFSFTTLKE